ncbi:MAG: peptidoglycan DD-metalloendopeptidase family protein [Proteobacteria bacterium]|nr:peptidoglycan DD-metalloendopeptidase family protein [Pseudomonadota bacterium]NIS69220.1 peptidoglycan DD-metalloendopeptidase family protein [Pseudomonadota bacterium]
MAGDHLTILIFSRDSSNVKRYKIPKPLLALVLITLPILIILAVILSLHFVNNTNYAIEITDFEKQNSIQQQEIRFFSEEIAGLQDRIAQMKEFDSKLRMIANLENRPSPFFGVGGPFPEDFRERIWSPNNSDSFARSARPDSTHSGQEAHFPERAVREFGDLVQEGVGQLPYVPSVWPCRGWIIGDFGLRISPLTGRPEMYEGIEISNSLDAPIVAPADGLVTTAGTDPEHGRMVVLSHGHGITTRYGNLARMDVTIGQKVRKGEVIGRMGNTGRSIGPHLYYEVRVKGIPTNPRNYLSN